MVSDTRFASEMRGSYNAAGGRYQSSWAFHHGVLFYSANVTTINLATTSTKPQGAVQLYCKVYCKIRFNKG